MRVAIYARYSSDLQRDTSLEDKIAVAKRYATEHKWTVLKDHIYTDAGISGASIQNRPSVQRLLAAAARKPKPFDVLLVDDSSRVARDIPDAIRVMQQLKFLGISVARFGVSSRSSMNPVQGVASCATTGEASGGLKIVLTSESSRTNSGNGLSGPVRPCAKQLRPKRTSPVARMPAFTRLTC